MATGYGLSPPSRKKRWAVVAAKLPVLHGPVLHGPVVHSPVVQGLLAVQGQKPQPARLSREVTEEAAAQVDGEKTSLQALAPDSPNLMSLAEPNRWALRDMSQIRSSAAEKLT